MIKVTTAVSAVKLMNQADVDDKNGTMIVNDWLLSVCCLSSIAYLVLPKTISSRRQQNRARL